MKPQVDKMTNWQNGKLKWQVDEMASWWNGKLMKWQVDEMASGWHGKLMKLQVDEFASWWNVKLMKWQVDEMASWHNGKLTKKPIDKMARQCDKLARLSLIFSKRLLMFHSFFCHFLKQNKNIFFFQFSKRNWKNVNPNMCDQILGVVLGHLGTFLHAFRSFGHIFWVVIIEALNQAY